jgi:hypothetical protein
MAFLDHVEREKFLRLNHRTEIVVDASVPALLDRLATTRPAGARFAG